MEHNSVQERLFLRKFITFIGFFLEMEPVKVGVQDEEELNNSVLIEEPSCLKLSKSVSPAPNYDLSLSMQRLDIKDNILLEQLLLPPINRQTLAELDIEGLQTNVQIMHDLYLEPDLRVQSKKLRFRNSPTQLYWEQVQNDLSILASEISACNRGTCSKRLVLLFKEIRNILCEMHPASERVQHDVKQYFDLEAVINDIELGQFDLEGFSSMLSDLLKSICAPKRDVLVDSLEILAVKKNFIGFMKQLLELLELMKLDLVNHQLKKSRDSICLKLPQSERNFIAECYLEGPIQMEQTTKWLQGMKDKLKLDLKQISVEKQVFALYSQSMISYSLGIDDFTDNIPELLLLDEVRLSNFRTEAQDMCIIACTISAFRQIVGPLSKPENIAALKKQVTSILLKGEAEVSEISDSLMEAIRKIKKVGVPASKVLEGLLNRMIDPRGKVYKILEDRVASYLVSILWKKESKIEGFNGLETELLDFQQRLIAMIRLNWAIHEETYREIIVNLR